MLSVVLQIGTPSPNTAFLFAAFAITGIVFLGYSALIIKRQREISKRLNELRDTSENATQE